jgi:hypothetical protein
MARDPFAGLTAGSKQKKGPAPVTPGQIPGKAVAGKASPRDLLATAATADDRKPGDTEDAAAADLHGLLQGFRSRAKAENDRFELAGDGGYYAVLVFPSWKHRAAFFEAVGAAEAVGLNFINGVRLAEKLKVPLPGVPAVSHSGRSAGPWLGIGTLPDR